jgi:hypothetical protein
MADSFDFSGQALLANLFSHKPREETIYEIREKERDFKGKHMK